MQTSTNSLALALSFCFCFCLCAHAKPLSSAVSPYSTYGECFRLKSPQDLLQHPLVLMGEPRSAMVGDALTHVLTGLSRDFALRFCRNVMLQDQDEELVPSPTPREGKERVLPLEHFDCDILMGGSLSFGVAREFDTNKQPVHAVYFKDPVEATLENYFAILRDPTHPKHKKISSMTLHDAIMEAGGLADTERHTATLAFNQMTWRLCGFDCSPANMSIHTALERATLNLNTRVSAVLLENSSLWLEMLQLTVRDSAALATVKRTAKLASTLTPAEQSILEHGNFADRILYSIAQGREVLQRKCMRTTARLPVDRLIRI